MLVAIGTILITATQEKGKLPLMKWDDTRGSIS